MPRTAASFSHLQRSLCGMSRTKASFEQLQLSLFEGSLACNAFLRDSDARNAAFCNAKRASEDGWGRPAA